MYRGGFSHGPNGAVKGPGIGVGNSRAGVACNSGQPQSWLLQTFVNCSGSRHVVFMDDSSTTYSCQRNVCCASAAVAAAGGGGDYAAANHSQKTCEQPPIAPSLTAPCAVHGNTLLTNTCACALPASYEFIIVIVSLQRLICVLCHACVVLQCCPMQL